ncbi:MAG: riboflavin synthase [Planctomycetes bacterium]|nr:riboflavin synthase [Planctomycetota bacterium]
MFTGLVEGQGTVQKLIVEGAGTRLVIAPPPEMLEGTAIGDSVAVNGCCLTVVARHDGQWDFQAGPETLSRTNLGDLRTGHTVNLERALPVNARLGGHFVQGHIDACGSVAQIETTGEWVVMWFQVPASLTRQMVSKGSITVDGVSLTLVDVLVDRFSVALIPHTLEVTSLGRRQVGDRVNLETDILAKYVEKLLVRPQ